jgi:hypothetical protein
MFKFLKPKTPKEQAEYNKQKIIDKNMKKIVKRYDDIINKMIENGITYENHAMISLITGSFQKESAEKALLELKNKWNTYGIVFEITWSGFMVSHIGISVKFI